MWETLIQPAVEQAALYRARGWWRDQTFLDDLARAVDRSPDRAAIIAYQGREHARTLSYARLAGTVARFAGALTELGVGRGDVVAIHLPNQWMLTPLYLACVRIGAVVAPIIPALGARELGQVLRRTAAKVCFAPDVLDGVDYVTRVAEAAPPTLDHHVVVGAPPPGALDFTTFFVDTPWEERHPLTGVEPLGADDVSLLLVTSGTTGEPKAVAHTQNTLYAAVRTVSEPYRLGADEVIAIPHYLTHMAGFSYAVHMPLLLGGTCVMQDTADMALFRDVVAEHGVTFGYAAPLYVAGLLAAQGDDPKDLRTLRYLLSGSAPIPPDLVTEVREALGVELGALWGMTENGAVTLTRPEDPAGWAADSDGRPEPWMEVRIDAEPGADLGRLLVRGASQTVGYLDQADVYAAQTDADGWFDTGDMARPDGRGGIRITGRRADLITTRQAAKVPTLEVEGVLTRHPAVREVVLIGYPDPDFPSADCVCAVVVADGGPPTLDQLTKFLDAERMTWENWPVRLELVPELPKNSLGKVLRPILRARLEDGTLGPVGAAGGSA
ncbi:AMP-binding protein [Longispora urticae]